jgi:hypothetical protein
MRYIIQKLRLWQAKRRSKRDNTFTLEQLEELTAKLKSRKS